MSMWAIKSPWGTRKRDPEASGLRPCDSQDSNAAVLFNAVVHAYRKISMRVGESMDISGEGLTVRPLLN
jgi:hypothetical protein